MLNSFGLFKNFKRGLDPVKALLAKDYLLAISLGFLDLDTKDLALAEYICPSKISLMKCFEEAKDSRKHIFIAFIYII